jgi:hypothetical protein
MGQTLDAMVKPHVKRPVPPFTMDAGNTILQVANGTDNEADRFLARARGMAGFGRRRP